METYNLVNQGSHLNDGEPSIPNDDNSIYFDSEVVDEVDEELHKISEVLERVKFNEPDKVNYKKLLIEAFKTAIDPFETEFSGEIKYEQNPSDPSKP